jgi:hypothetical protein
MPLLQSLNIIDKYNNPGLQSGLVYHALSELKKKCDIKNTIGTKPAYNSDSNVNMKGIGD